MTKSWSTRPALVLATALVASIALVGEVAAQAANPAPGGAGGGAAIQTQGQIKGKIQNINMSGRSLTLDNGKTYTWGASVTVPNLQNGQNVALTVDPTNPNAVLNVALAD